MFFTNPESTNFFHEMLCFIFQSFSVMINIHIGIFALNRKLLPCTFDYQISKHVRLFDSQEQVNKAKKISWKKFVDSRIVKTCDEPDLGKTQTSYQSVTSGGLLKTRNNCNLTASNLINLLEIVGISNCNSCHFFGDIS